MKIRNIVIAGAFLSSTLPFVSGATIGQRKENQQDRVAQGVKSGQMTAGETSHIEKKESAINKEERADRTVDNGKLTPADRKAIHQQQNQMSRRIYRDKHNAAKQ